MQEQHTDSDRRCKRISKHYDAVAANFNVGGCLKARVTTVGVSTNSASAQF